MTSRNTIGRFPRLVHRSAEALGIAGFRQPAARALLLLTAGLLSAQTQTITIASVSNLADFQPGLPQAGSPAAILTTGLVGEPGVTLAAPVYPVSNVMNGVGVWIGSLPEPILSLAFLNGYQQIDVQVPWEISGFNVEVSQNGVQADAEATYTGGIGFGGSVFFADAHGYAIVQHGADYSQVTPQNPAHSGEYLIAYGINLGPVINQPLTGAASPFSPLAFAIPNSYAEVCSQSDSISLGVYPPGPVLTPALYSGLTPGSVGLYQINFQVPPNVTTGDVQVSFVRDVVEQPAGVCPGVPSRAYLVTYERRAALLPIK